MAPRIGEMRARIDRIEGRIDGMGAGIDGTERASTPAGIPAAKCNAK
jgi:hypothetical protein